MFAPIYPLQAVSEAGAGFVVGTTRGRIMRFDIAADKQGQMRIMEGSKQEVKLEGGNHSEAIDCMVRFIYKVSLTLVCM